MTFKPGSEAAKLAAKATTPKESVLAGLPEGKFIVAGGAEISRDTMTAIYKWSMNFVRATEIDALVKASEESFAGLKSAAFAMYAPKKNDPLYSSVIGLMRVDDAAKFMANYERAISIGSALAEKSKSPFLQKAKAEKTTIEGKEGFEITMSIPNQASDPISAELFKKMFGDAEKMKVYVAPVSDTVAAIGYITPDGIKRVMKSAGAKGIAGDGDIVKSAELLPAGCQAQMFVNLKGMVDMVLENVPGLEFTPATALLGDFPETPPLGFGLKTSSDGLESDLVVPEETLEAIGTVIARARAVSHDAGIFVHDTYFKLAPPAKR
jgi:hypothetical protein